MGSTASRKTTETLRRRWPGRPSLLDLPPEVRLLIWQYALYEPVRIVMLGVHTIFGTRSQAPISDDLGKPRVAKPMGGEFYSRKGRARFFEGFKTDESGQMIWPSCSRDVIKTLSLLCQESRYEVTQTYPDIIWVSSTGKPDGPRFSLPCNMKEDIFLLEIGMFVEIRATSDAHFFDQPPRCYGDVHAHNFNTANRYHWDQHRFPERFMTPEESRGEAPIPQSNEAEAARDDEFCQSLKAMRKIAFLTGLAYTERWYFQVVRRDNMAARIYPFNQMLTTLPNLEIIYFLPPNVPIGDEQDIRAVPFRLDDVWRPGSGRTRGWQNPHSYIEYVKRFFPRGAPLDEKILEMSAVHVERVYERALAAEGGLGAWFTANRNARDCAAFFRSLAETELGLDNTGYDAAVSSRAPTRVEMATMAKEGKLPTIGLLLPGTSYKGDTVDLELLARDRSTDEEPDWGPPEDYQMGPDDRFPDLGVEPLDSHKLPSRGFRHVFEPEIFFLGGHVDSHWGWIPYVPDGSFLDVRGDKQEWAFRRRMWRR